MDTTTPLPDLLSPSVLALPLALFVACGEPSASSEHIPTAEPHVAATVTASAQLHTGAAALRVHGPPLEARTMPQPEPEPELELEPEPEPSPSWTLVQRAEDEIDFAPVSRGLLMYVDGAPFTLDERGALVAAPKKATTVASVVGSWPDDAWTVRTRIEERAGAYVRVAKWKSNRRWVPQPIKDSPDYVWTDEHKWHEFSTEFWGTPGGRGGYLLTFLDYETDNLVFRRLGGENFAPVDFAVGFGEGDVGWPRDVYETPSGRLLVFTQIGDSSLEVLERPRCRKDCKVESIELPAGLGDRYLGQYTMRGEDSVSFTLRAGWQDKPGTQLLSRDAQGWTLEDPPISNAEFRDLAAGADEGLFAVVGVGTREQLWHRDSAANWSLVELPEPFDAKLGVAAALPLALELTTSADGTLWVAINSEANHLLYTLPGELG